MYLEYYNLRETPFSLTPDPAFLYQSQSHKRAIAFLKYGLQESKGFLQLTGPVGSGKTTILRAILSQLDERTKTAYIFNPSAPFPDLLRSIMKDLEISNIPATRSKLELLDFFHEYLLVQTRRSNRVVLIIDEAQNLGVRNLEEIRMLSNFETTKDKLIQIALVGQPELIPILDLPELRQLKQRIQVRYHLAPLSPAEVQGYIKHRLHIAGAEQAVKFTDDACEAVFRFSNGIPRLINSVCDIALLIGYVSETKIIDSSLINEAVKEIQGSFDTSENESQPIVNQNETLDPHIEIEDPIYPDSSEPEIPSTDEESTSTATYDARVKASEEPVPEAAGPPTLLAVEAEPETKVDETAEPGTAAGPAEPLSLPAAFSFLPNSADVEEEEIQDVSQGCSPRPQTVDNPEGPARDVEEHAEFDSDKKNAELQETQRQQPAETTGVPANGGAGFIARIRRIVESLRLRELLGLPIKPPAQGQNLAGPENAERERPQDNPPPASPDQGAAAAPHVLICPSRFLNLVSSWKIARKSQSYLLSNHAAKTPEGFINSKIMILMKDSSVARGIAEGLDLGAEGFNFIPYETSKGNVFVQYEGLIAVKLIESFDERWKRRSEVSGKCPKGRHVVVTLLNGEIIEGITLARLKPHCQRFFVISPNGDGTPSWVLVEKTGTAGILTELFETGIYAEQFTGFDEIADAIPDETVRKSQLEISGDLLFSLQDYRGALVEYERISLQERLPERLHLKICASHYNLGIQQLRNNYYAAAIKEFALAAINQRLREKALAKIQQVERLLNGNGTVQAAQTCGGYL